ncbi:DUF1353 domain-containing protein [Sphingomonas sp. G-3-2-10]|uniref:DUF1353 domain-containing protein n=1 Tax=Sphingomonas sp. G-3-2-10 TaxID=2728838 RepID=UPI00146BC9C3|nr:DUF1353 domain-containing protein [Sphingomonas sp. G-3-2-10]NML05112.1 DUF1353 domain-containing protein [Sphingomonas sp. G-3-2-10]
MTETLAISTLDEATHYLHALLEYAPDGGGGLESTVTGFGSYIGLPPQVALLPDGRLGELLAPIEYIQESSKQWPVPKGASLDGASIPRPLWSIIGGPFEGRYRDASIVHDHYCVVKTEPWRETHRMFYEAMRCSGVGTTKAKVMFYAVHRFGPRWGGGGLESLAPAPLTDADAETLVRDAMTIAASDPDIETIEALADSRE